MGGKITSTRNLKYIFHWIMDTDNPEHNMIYREIKPSRFQNCPVWDKRN